jgi:hypothetical protein
MGETTPNPTPVRPPRASAILTQRRVGELLRIRLDGAERWDVLEYVREKEQEKGSAWEVPEGTKPMSDSMIGYLLTKADALIHASHDRSRKKLFSRHLAQRRNLYAKAVLAGDLRTALACVKDEAEMLGLYPPKTVKNEMTGKGGKDLHPPGIPPTDAELAAGAAMLAAAAAALNDPPPAGGPPP